MIIYLHGLNSSPLSEKCVLLTEYCAKKGVDCIAPQLHHRPKQAIAQIEPLLKEEGEHLLVGSSMGGYYATWLCENHSNTRAVLINPAVKLADKITDYVGKEQTNYHNLEDKYMFTEEHLEEFRELEITTVAAPEKYFLLAQTGDELLDYREAETLYAGGKQAIEEGGSHSFDGFERFIPEIVKFSGAVPL